MQCKTFAGSTRIFGGEVSRPEGRLRGHDPELTTMDGGTVEAFCPHQLSSTLDTETPHHPRPSSFWAATPLDHCNLLEAPSVSINREYVWVHRFFSFSNLAEIASTILSSTHLWMKRGLGGWSHRPWPRSGIPHPHSLCAAGRASKLYLSAQKKEKPFFLCHFLKGEIRLKRAKIHYQGIFINYLKCFLTTFTISQTVQRQKVKVVLL